MTKSKTNKPAEKNNSGQPLFFKDPCPVQKDKHAKSGIKKEGKYAFARDTNTIPVNAAEFAETAKTYPIVFTVGDEPTPLAIVGAKKDKNIFVGKEGDWKEDVYIPAYVRRYPFAFSGEREKLTLCIDEAADLFVSKAKKNDLAFFDDGKQTEVLDSALKFCGQYHDDFLVTVEACKQLKKHNLLRERKLTIDLPGMKKPLNLTGFQTIDEEAFAKLDQKVIYEWHKNGILSLIYLQLLSGSNWSKIADKLI